MAVVINGTTGITAPGLETFGDGTALGGATNPIVSMAKAANNYVQGYVVNNTAGASSSADLVAYPDNGTDAHGWVDMGVTSSVYADATYTVTGPNEAYLFGSAPSGAGKTGNLVLATDNTGTANSIQFYTNGFTQAKSAARVTIDSSGNLLVGTTSSVGTSLARVEIQSISGGGRAINTKSDITTSSNALSFNNPNGQVGSIATNGSLTAYNVSSDYRLKENITSLTGALDKVSQLKPSLYNYKADPAISIEGFIAHELAEVVPHAVTGEKDGVDAEGNPSYQGIDVSFLIPHLTAAIQELKAIVDAQAAQIAALEAKA